MDHAVSGQVGLGCTGEAAPQISMGSKHVSSIFPQLLLQAPTLTSRDGGLKPVGIAFGHDGSHSNRETKTLILDFQHSGGFICVVL